MIPFERELYLEMIVEKVEKSKNKDKTAGTTELNEMNW